MFLNEIEVRFKMADDIYKLCQICDNGSKFSKLVMANMTSQYDG